MGLNLTETLDMPFGDLLTLINIEMIKVEGAKQKANNDFDIIPDID